MKTCPKCTSVHVRYSHTRTPIESLQRNWLSYRFYRCQDCDWRGKERQKKKVDKFDTKLNLWKLFFIYSLATVLMLIVVFVMILGIGDARSPSSPSSPSSPESNN
jgi:hypothetical protein